MTFKSWSDNLCFRHTCSFDLTVIVGANRVTICKRFKSRLLTAGQISWLKYHKAIDTFKFTFVIACVTLHVRFEHNCVTWFLVFRRLVNTRAYTLVCCMEWKIVNWSVSKPWNFLKVLRIGYLIRIQLNWMVKWCVYFFRGSKAQIGGSHILKFILFS